MMTASTAWSFGFAAGQRGQILRAPMPDSPSALQIAWREGYEDGLQAKRTERAARTGDVSWERLAEFEDYIASTE